MSRILFITTELPFPARSGGTIKSFKLIDHLSRKHELSVFALVDANSEEREEAFLKEVNLDAYASFKLKRKRNLMNLLRSYTRKIPLNQYRNYHPKAAEIIHHMAVDVDMVIIDHYEMGIYLDEVKGPKIIYHAHNAEFKLWERLAQLEREPLKKRAISLETQRVIAAEKRLISSSSLNFMAESDHSKFEELGIEIPNYAETKHLGSDHWLKEADIEFENTEKALFYMGSLSWPANSDGLVWFFQKVWPILIEKEPDLKFKLLGKGAKRELKKQLRKWPQVESLGYVEDPMQVMGSCRVGVVPLRYGSGMKIKVLDNLYRGLPMVTTDIGVEGIDLEHGTHLSVANDEEAFVKSVLELLEDRSVWTKYRDNSRSMGKSRYLWKSELEHFEKMLNKKKAIPS